MRQEKSKLKLQEEQTVRIYCDVSHDIEMKMRMRAITLQQELQRRFTRKDYLEYLVSQDVAKIKGASLRTLKGAKSQTKGS
jgi:hypothetical protein